MGRFCARALAGAGEHRLGDVEPEHVAAGTDPGGEVERRRAAAAADVDHAIAGLGVRDGEEPVGHGAEHLVLMFLMGGPFWSGRRSPVFGLGGIIGVDWRGGHGDSSLASDGAGELDQILTGRNGRAARRWQGDRHAIETGPH